MITDAEIRSALVWEDSWFRRVNALAASPGEKVREATTAGASRTQALRMLRHAIWYLRARRRDENDWPASNLILECLQKMREAGSNGD